MFGLVLQLVLLFLLFTRRMASQLWLFTVLLCFYAIRSILLFTLFTHLSRAAYASLYTGLSLLDLLLQIAVAIELARVILRFGAKSLLPRALLVPIFFLLSAALTVIVAVVLPAHSQIPVDRGTIFTGFLFVQLFAWSLTVRLSRWRQSVLAGLAGIGAAGILSQAARSLAAFHHNAHAFLLWSYFNAGAYLLVVLLWIWLAGGRISLSSIKARILLRP